MAVYKIPQDVEADDKFVGPLSFKQFIYVGIAAISVYLSFLALTKHFWPAIIFFFPVIVATGFLGFPWGRDQPTEIWLAARIRFFIKPRMRIWNQSGIKDLVTVTAPKHIERHYTNGLSQDEVTSRLGGLADLLDSRGWAVKNVNVNMYSNMAANSSPVASDDRLIGATSLPQEVVDVTAGDDVLDETNNPTAQHFEQMIKSSEEKHRQDVMAQLQAARSGPQPATPTSQAAMPAQQQGMQSDASAAPQKQQGNADFWFLQQGGHADQHQAAKQIVQNAAVAAAVPDPGFTTFQAPDMVAPHSAAPILTATETTTANQRVSAGDEQALLNKIHHDHEASYNPFGHIKTIQPIDDTPAITAQPAAPAPLSQAAQADNPYLAETAPPPAPAPMPMPPPTPVTPPVDPAIMNLASNDDLNVATIARQADKSKEQRLSDGEVVISLH